MIKWKRVLLPDGTEKLKFTDDYMKEKVKQKEKQRADKKKITKKQEEYIARLLKTIPENSSDYSILKRFFAKVHIKEGDECWKWLGALDSSGYGSFNFNGHILGAHRVVWFLVNGQIPENMYILHKCDNRKCVNPNHLFLGTFQDNINDRNNKNRQAKGEALPQSRLTQEIVNEIRKEYLNSKSVKMKDLSKKYNVSYATINDILNNKRWKDSTYIPEPRTGKEGECSESAKFTQ